MKLKRIGVYIIIFLMSTLSVVAQNKKRARIKALKTAYITEALELNSDNTEKFWDIYNAYQRTLYQTKVVPQRAIKKRIHTLGGVENLSSNEADAIAKKLFTIDLKLAEQKKKLYTSLSAVISSKQMIKLIFAERSFNKELLKKLRTEKRK